MPAGSVRGTPAPDQVQLRRLAREAGDPLRRPGAQRGGPLDPRLLEAAAAAGGHCAYLPELCCGREDFRAWEALARDVAAAGEALVPHRTRKRLQVFGEELQGSEAFATLVARMLGAFGGLSLVDCWVNVYRDGRETTGWHQDHYNLRQPHACATLNLNLGATRSLALEHLETGRRFEVVQENGSLFAFDAMFNAAFKHSVPPDPKLQAEPFSLRLSITVFAIEGPQPPAVTRDLDNVPPGVPLIASWEGWSLKEQTWSPSELLPLGEGAQQLLASGGPLLRGHQKGDKGKGRGRGEGGRGHGRGGVDAPKAIGGAPAASERSVRWQRLGEERGQPHGSKDLEQQRGEEGGRQQQQDEQQGQEKQPQARRRWMRRGEKSQDAPGNVGVPSDMQPARRVAKDGNAYTKDEFRRFFGGYSEWDVAPPL